VLAATSVLGDLIDKCPPAEACRDAFDRMSKATIQMCMSTTGFGPQALQGHPQMHASMRPPHSPSTTYTSDTDARSETDIGVYGSVGYFQQGRRPVPRFDMDLKDLFSENETDKRSLSRISNQLGNMRPPPPPQQIKQESQHMQPFTTDLKISPQMRSHQSLPQQQAFTYPQQQAQTQALSSPQFPTSTTPTLSPPVAQTLPSMPSPYQISNQLPYNSFAQSIASTYPDYGFSDLDFLDSFPVQGAGSMGNGGDVAGVGGVQDLGFGMEFGDGTHDWSDGNGFELLGGFFFGGSGNGNGM
jgi:hypothetical protein